MGLSITTVSIVLIVLMFTRQKAFTAFIQSKISNWEYMLTNKYNSIQTPHRHLTTMPEIPAVAKSSLHQSCIVPISYQYMSDDNPLTNPFPASSLNRPISSCVGRGCNPTFLISGISVAARVLGVEECIVARLRR